MKHENGVIIVGGGWAGMAAALELDRHHIPVTVLESAARLGGRARSVMRNGHCLDNGQHLLIGAYHETLRLLQLMEIQEADVLRREPLHLHVLGGEQPLELAAPSLPAPLHLAWGLLTAKGIGYRDKLQALRMSLALSMSGFSLAKDISVADLLQRHHQGSTLIRRFWEPLCIATLNTPIELASGRVFLRVLKDSFSEHRRDADLLIPRVPLGSLFPEAAERHLCHKPGNQVRLKERVITLDITTGKVNGVSTRQQTLHSSDVILAVSPTAASRLLSPYTELRPLADAITQLGSQPIITVYLQYPTTLRLPRTMIGMSGTVSQWLFDRRVCGRPGLIAVVVSADGAHTAWDNERLIGQIRSELQNQFPHWPAAEEVMVIREKRATFECRVGIEEKRPGNDSAVKGLWLAGDYTDTGYPATLEGAVRSGVQCARRIIEQRHSSSK